MRDLYFGLRQPLKEADPLLKLFTPSKKQPLPHFGFKEDRGPYSSTELSGKPSVHYISQNLH